MHATICDYLADIAQNAIEAGASLIEVKLTEDDDYVKVAVKDNGKGMDAATLKRACDPFYSAPGKHDRRRVGLGLPLLHQAVEATGGKLTLDSTPGVGTEVEFSFTAGHFDTPPLGGLPVTVATLMACDGEYNLEFSRKRHNEGYRVSRLELSDALGDLRVADNLALTIQFLRSQEDHLRDVSGAAGSTRSHDTAH